MRTYIWMFTESVGNPLEDQLLPHPLTYGDNISSRFQFQLLFPFTGRFSLVCTERRPRWS